MGFTLIIFKMFSTLILFFLCTSVHSIDFRHGTKTMSRLMSNSKQQNIKSKNLSLHQVNSNTEASTSTTSALSHQTDSTLDSLISGTTALSSAKYNSCFQYPQLLKAENRLEHTKGVIKSHEMRLN